MSTIKMPDGLQVIKFSTEPSGKTTTIKAMYNGKFLPVLDVDYANLVAFSKKIQEAIEDMHHRANEYALQEMPDTEYEDDTIEFDVDQDFLDELNDESEDE